MTETDGVGIIGILLVGNAPLVAATGTIRAGNLAEDAALPALLVRAESKVDRQPLRRGAKVRSTERVAVTVRAKNYRELRMLIRMVRDACGGKVAALIGDAERVSVLTAGTGPDLDGPGDTFERTQDFSVSYDADA